MPDNNQNSNSDPIEELFRRKTDEYEISYREADWLRLEKRLDERERKRKQRNRRIWMAAAAMLLFALLGYFTYQNYQTVNELNRQLSEQHEVPAEEPPTGDDSIDDGTTQAIPGVTADSGMTASESDTADQSSGSQQFSTRTQQNVNDTSSPTAGNDSTAVSQAQQATSYIVNKAIVREPQGFNSPCEGCALTSNQILRWKPARFLLAEAPRAQSEDVEPGNPSVGAEDRQLEARSSLPLTVGITAGPDMSTVGSFSNFTDPGFLFGVSIAYQISENLAISTGIGQANVRYTARGSEYDPPYGYWTNGIAADQTIAECAILEIPISLKYNFLHFDNSRIFASAGVSSYIMLNEEYSFRYDDNSTGLAQEWSGQTGTRHWLSTATISIGYEIDILKNWSLQAAPFAKLPLKEVGWGNVKLYSLGTSVSINYSL